ncbi:DUF3618 domain-containing protein [Sphingomonas sp. RB3P16]|uniref:DUF3618 domain-containing protein n=1 Tax=Parasphingomonas frigoris TaxID=3096163 RepID=UPI002FCB49F1
MSETKLALAQARADAARAQLSTTISALQHRTSPQVLAQDVADTIRERSMDALSGAVETARRRPVPTGIGVALVGLFLARGPIAKSLRRATHSKSKS